MEKENEPQTLELKQTEEALTVYNQVRELLKKNSHIINRLPKAFQRIAGPESEMEKERDDKKTIRCLRRDLKRANNTISELQKAKRACAHRQIQPQMTAGFSDSSATASQSVLTKKAEEMGD
ncbi:uncharacterized protein LOC128216984 [Mya arenaria]|uniref:uncharacterized protein LOC128216984 n=1 Tax=Mya arenaria TaxID=6604 RepID=UPI0022E8573C|nr:uncharacterized protein LOC128216984 [Mya arenaria]